MTDSEAKRRMEASSEADGGASPPKKVSTAETAPPAPAPSRADEDAGFRPEMLKVYYNRLFPYDDMFRWLSYGHDKLPEAKAREYMQKREFCFTLENDIFVRYQSFGTAADMAASIREKCPEKIDIGPFYNINPRTRASHQGSGGAMDLKFVPVERELVFDIDMTDYDDMRTCCTGAKVCELCWTLITVAIKVVDRVLRDDFGFEHLLWVFSGRRGVHCWVCDGRARRLKDDQRSAIADYFRVYTGSEENARKVAFTGATLHPTLMRAYEEVLLPYFENRILGEQGLLQDETAWNKMLAAIPDTEIRDRLAEKWRSDRRGTDADASLARWKQLEATVRQAGKKNSAVRRSVEEIVFGHTYPRLDLEVSKHMNHLLKAPFCVHPKTGKVCVPIDPSKCEEFNPDKVPTLRQLIEDINQDGSDPLSGKQQTSLDQHVSYFQSTFLDNLLPSCKDEMKAEFKADLAMRKQETAMAW